MQEKNKERIRWIDFARFLSIFLVVWLHTGAPTIIDRTVHSFHMPIFYFLSGYCFDMERHKDFKVFWNSRIRGLMVPYTFFGIAGFIFWNTIYIVFGETLIPILPYAKSLLWKCVLPLSRTWGGVQWFLPSLFFTEIIFWTCCHFLNKWKMILVVLLIGVIGFLFPNICTFRLPLALDTSLTMLIFFAFGNIIREKRILAGIEKTRPEKLLAGSILSMLFCFLIDQINGSESVNIRLLKFENPLLFTCAAICGISSIVCLSVIIDRIFERNGKLLRNGILYFGQNTIIILYAHRLYNGICDLIIHERYANERILGIFLTILFFLLIAYPCCLLINRYGPWIIGRNKYDSHFRKAF